MTRFVHLSLATVFLLCAHVGMGCSDGKTGRGAPPALSMPAPKSLKFAWTPPTTDTSGQALGSRLAGYTLYYGPSPRTYSSSIEINDPQASEYTDTGQVPPGLWYFALTARDTGGLESDFSNEVSKVVQ